ncbi:MAG: ABC transporter substrate-binding protein [Gammaproteobacteria bacterium]|nr:ABC transporter substrate-binding protein [Gammaproteobacteria bacterium]
MTLQALGKKLLHGSIIILTIITAGCESVNDTMTRPDDKTRPTENTEQLIQEGQFSKAANNLIRLARGKPATEQTSLFLRASSLFIKNSQIDEAKRLLNQITPDPNNKILNTQINHINSQISLFEGMPEQVINSLIPDPSLPPRLQIVTHRLRAQAYLLAGNTLESARERIALQPLLTDPEQSRLNHEQIWQSLRQLTPLALKQLNLAPPPDILGGWMELARISISSILDPATFETDLAKWQATYPDHPARQWIMAQLLNRYQTIKRPEKLALILPFSGKLAKPAIAIRDGFLAAHYQNQSNLARTEIKIYDSSKQSQTIEQIYQQAVTDGAEFIIGPLDKQQVTQLANITDIKIPVLTLNQTDTLPSVTGNFFQFGLIPEDEARQIAERASLEGLIRATVITPKGAWGDRLANAFKQRFEELGGTVLEISHYNFNNPDLSGPIKRMLNLDESQRRYNRLKNALPTEIKFEPRRRQDIDFIFMAAFPKQARLIVPQLRFHHAAGIPVYTTSHAYNGKENVNDNRDINGVILSDSAWILSPESTADPLRKTFFQLWPQSMDHYARLYAFGMDAYRLLGQIKWLHLNPNEYFNGVSGRLYLNQQNQIKRILQWGQFKRGRISILENIKAPDIDLNTDLLITP